MKNQHIAIIGATGKTGMRVHQRLQQQGFSPRALSRGSQPGFDWTRPETWHAALQGMDAVYITYQPDLAVPSAEQDIEHLIDIARQAGVSHLVLLSGRGEDGAQRAEDRIMASGLDWNVVRCGWFMQNFSESFMLDGILSRHLVLPEAKATEPFIDVDDIADLVVASLTRPELRNRLFEVTGPELLSFADCVQSIAAAIGEPLIYQPIPLEDYLDIAAQNGMSDDMAWLIRELFSVVLDGRNENTTDTIADVLGRPARRFDDYVRRTVQSGVWKVQQAREHLQ